MQGYIWNVNSLTNNFGVLYLSWPLNRFLRLQLQLAFETASEIGYFIHQKPGNKQRVESSEQEGRYAFGFGFVSNICGTQQKYLELSEQDCRD